MTRRSVLLSAACALAVLWAVGWSSGDAAADRAATEIHERNRAIVARAYHKTRDSLPAFAEAVRTAQGEAALADARLRRVTSNVLSVTDSSRVVVADPAASDTALRTQLAAQVAVTDSLMGAVEAYRTAQDSLATAFAAQRALLYSALARSDLLNAANVHVIAELKRERCRVLVLPCPTRTQAFVGGAIVTAAAVLVLR